MKKVELYNLIPTLTAISKIGSLKFRYAIHRNLTAINKLYEADRQFIISQKPNVLTSLETSLSQWDKMQIVGKKWEHYEELQAEKDNFNKTIVEPFLNQDSDFEFYNYLLSIEELEQIDNEFLEQNKRRLQGNEFELLAIIDPNIKAIIEG